MLLAARGQAWLGDLIHGLESGGRGGAFPFLSLSIIYPGFLSGSLRFRRETGLAYTARQQSLGNFLSRYFKINAQAACQASAEKRNMCRGVCGRGVGKGTWALTRCLLFLSFQAAVPIVLTKTFFSPQMQLAL